MSSQHAHFDGIDGLSGRVPIGAALTIGRKGPKGAPIERDRFFFKLPVADAEGVRPEHPLFRKYHALQPENRRTIPAALVHATRSECFEYHLRAQRLPKHETHPRDIPTCVGDGKRATRYMGEREGEHHFEEIACPNDACQFRRDAGRGGAPCKPWARLLFRPVWKPDSGLPAPLVKFTTQSWHTIGNIVGFFDYLASQARALGVSDPALYGLTFDLALAEKTSRERKSRFPVVSLAPTVDVQQFLLRQVEIRRELASQPKPVALIDESEQSPEVIAADRADIVPGGGSTPRAETSDVVDVPPSCECGEVMLEHSGGEGYFCEACGLSMSTQDGLFR